MKLNQICKRQNNLWGICNLPSNTFFIWNIKVTKKITEFFFGFFTSGLVFDQKCFFYEQIEDNMSWTPHLNAHFSKCEHLLNPTWVTETINRQKKARTGRFSQPYSLLRLFLTKTNVFFLLDGRKITWVDHLNHFCICEYSCS